MKHSSDVQMHKAVQHYGFSSLDSYPAIVTAAVTGDAWTGHNTQLDEDMNRLRGLMESLCGICDMDVGWQCDGHSAPDH